jgi:hypothetical protein
MPLEAADAGFNHHRQEHAMNTLTTITAVLAFAFSVPALAQQTDHRLGEHPAVIVKRMQTHQGYDYASKFYPHPAWLYLYAEAPHPMMDHPAVIVFRRQAQETQAVAATPSLAAAASR